jgi:hypothetical protein
MLAFDAQLPVNLYAMPQFQSDFGYKYNGTRVFPFFYRRRWLTATEYIISMLHVVTLRPHPVHADEP